MYYETYIDTKFGTRKFLYFGAAQAYSAELSREKISHTIRMLKVTPQALNVELTSVWVNGFPVPRKD